MATASPGDRVAEAPTPTRKTPTHHAPAGVTRILPSLHLATAHGYRSGRPERFRGYSA